jgi:hypothetical protein
MCSGMLVHGDRDGLDSREIRRVVAICYGKGCGKYIRVDLFGFFGTLLAVSLVDEMKTMGIASLLFTTGPHCGDCAEP